MSEKRSHESSTDASKKARAATGDLVVGWFRNDLRIRDNPVLAEVLAKAQAGALPALLVYIFDPRFYDRSNYGRVTDPEFQKSIRTRRPLDFSSRKCGARRARFYVNVLRDVRSKLRALGTELWFFYGKPEEVFAELSAQYGVLQVLCLREPVSPEWTDVEEATQAALREKGGSLTTLWGAMSLYHEEDLPFTPQETPGCYTGLTRDLGWDDLWTSGRRLACATPIRKPLPAPSGPAPKQPATPAKSLASSLLDDERQTLVALGFSLEEIDKALSVPHGGVEEGRSGETAAWVRMEAWLALEPSADQGAFADWCLPTSGSQYTEHDVDVMQWKNLSRPDGWMQISHYLACGCISPREIYHTLADGNHWALPGVAHRLMWREWHRLNAIKFHRRLYWLQGPGRQDLSWKHDPETAERWKAGHTGIPYIDACMRELNETGWLAYKGRKTTAAVLGINLWIDWRIGAFHFEEMLLDYDVAMNYGNWVTCCRVDKDYDVYDFRRSSDEALELVLNSEMVNDAEGTYIRRWVPELRDVPLKYLHCPWRMDGDVMKSAGCVVGTDYPKPVIAAQKLLAQTPNMDKPKDGEEGYW